MPERPAPTPAAPGRRFTRRHAAYALFALCLAVSIWTQDARAVMLFVLALLLYVMFGVGEWRGQQDR